MLAKALGEHRQAQSVAKGLKDSHGFEGDGALIHTEGVGGELAFAKAYDLYPGFTEGTFKTADFCANIQVKTRSKHSYDLLVRKDDSPEDIFVLVTGQLPKYRIRGWMLGHEAMKEQFLEVYGGREPAFFPPREALRDIRTLVMTEKRAYPVAVLSPPDASTHPF